MEIEEFTHEHIIEQFVGNWDGLSEIVNDDDDFNPTASGFADAIRDDISEGHIATGWDHKHNQPVYGDNMAEPDYEAIGKIMFAKYNDEQNLGDGKMADLILKIRRDHENDQYKIYNFDGEFIAELDADGFTGEDSPNEDISISEYVDDWLDEYCFENGYDNWEYELKNEEGNEL